jgi:predicted DNA-binding transcriptional regulator AlpA
MSFENLASMKLKREIEVTKVIQEPRSLLTVEETARRLGLRRQTIYNGIGRRAKKRFPLRPKRIGGKPLFDNKDIEAFIESLPYETDQSVHG